MTHIILKNDLDPNKVEALLNFFRSFDIDAEIKTTKNETKRSESFSLAAGLWEDYDVDAESLRKQAWSRR